jgi:hypothetical protein
MYDDASANVCKKCDPTCLYCDGPSDKECSACKPESKKELLNGQCACKAGFKVGENDICVLINQNSQGSSNLIIFHLFRLLKSIYQVVKKIVKHVNHR